jgi:hypothetical protein
MMLVLSTTLVAWVTSRSVNPIGRAAGSPIGRGIASATQSVEDVRSHAERGNEELEDKVVRNDTAVQLPGASYPEGDQEGTVLASGAERKAQKQSTGQTNAGSPCQAGACKPGANEVHTQLLFAKDPMEAAELAKREHKLMLVLHVSGNFEESKFT